MQTPNSVKCVTPDSATGRKTIAIAIATLLASVLLLGTAPLAGGHDGVLDVNNMSCADLIGTREDAEGSGPPYHDFAAPRVRVDCSSIITEEPPLQIGYSVAPGIEPHLRGELYLLPREQGETASGSTCLWWWSEHGSENWNCGTVEESDAWPTPEQFWDNVHRNLPLSPTPSIVEYQIGFSATGTGTPSTIDNWHDLITFSGTFIPIGNISDPGGADSYTSSQEFRNWTILDPGRDDRLVVNDTPMDLDTGTSLTFSNDNITVEYEVSEEDSENNEWTVKSTDESETVFVWHSGGSEWTIYRLDY